MSIHNLAIKEANLLFQIFQRERREKRLIQSKVFYLLHLKDLGRNINEMKGNTAKLNVSLLYDTLFYLGSKLKLSLFCVIFDIKLEIENFLQFLKHKIKPRTLNDYFMF